MIVCYKCGEQGHRKPDCPNAEKVPSAYCFACRQPGHTFAKCPLRNAPPPADDADAANANANGDDDEEQEADEEDQTASATDDSDDDAEEEESAAPPVAKKSKTSAGAAAAVKAVEPKKKTATKPAPPPKASCYRCGSADHTSRNCVAEKAGCAWALVLPIIEKTLLFGAVQHNCFLRAPNSLSPQSAAGFQYATCFNCKKQGHLASQCPLGARSIYPRGGKILHYHIFACKYCIAFMSEF